MKQSKQIQYGSDARAKLSSGVKNLSKAVKSTLGPSGRNVLIKKKNEESFSTKDGVTVASAFSSDDYIEQVAIESIQKVSANADAKAGDGTTTATVLAEYILQKGLDFPKHLNLLDIKKGIDRCAALVSKTLLESAQECKSLEDLRNVALISSNYDEEVANIVIDAFKISGKQGIVNIKRSRDIKSEVTSIQGMNMPTGYQSKEYINDYENEICEFNNAYVFMTNKKIKDVSKNLTYLLDKVADAGRELVIICKDIDVLVSNMLIQNKRKGAIKVCVCKAPGFGMDQEALLRDIGVSLGQQPFIENDAIDFDDLDEDAIFDYIPVSEAVYVSEQNLSIKANESEKEKMEARADILREKLEEKHLNSYEKSVLQARISRLTDGIAIINIGALTDIEFVEKQHRIQDALYAVKGANDEGIVPGGGAALYTIAHSQIDMPFNPSMAYGYQIVLDSIKMPLIQICQNAGIEIKTEKNFFSRFLKKHNYMSEQDHEIIKEHFEYGYDVKSNNVVNMIDKKIIDPVKVTRVALENAASISGLLLTTECVIVEENAYYNPEFKNE